VCPIYLLGSRLSRWLGINWSFQQIRGESGESCSTLLPAAAAGWLNSEIRLNFLWRPELREHILMTCPFYRSKTVLDHDRNILDWSKIGFQFGLGLKTVFSFSELFWTFRRTWQYSDVLSFYRSKTVLDHDQSLLDSCPNNLSLGSKWLWILDQEWLSSMYWMLHFDRCPKILNHVQNI
jgi:hypothetical protein